MNTSNNFPAVFSLGEQAQFPLYIFDYFPKP